MEEFKCMACQATFRSEGELKAHEQQAHAEELACPACEGKFGTRRELDDHAESAHAA